MATALLTVLTGIVYPIAVWAIAQTIFPSQASGSLIVAGDKVVGSRLIGQNFSSPRYFQSRPSAAGDKGYAADNSSGSNLGPTNKALIDAVKLRLKNFVESNPGIDAQQVPVDLVTSSGSGLDPEISPAAAGLQVGRVARARALSEDQVRQLIAENHAVAIGGNLRRARRKRSVAEPGSRSRDGKSWRNSRDLNER